MNETEKILAFANKACYHPTRKVNSEWLLLVMQARPSVKDIHAVYFLSWSFLSHCGEKIPQTLSGGIETGWPEEEKKYGL
ncbi:MAG: hypothetical protein V8Q40_07405 [Anaerosacchariphilus sp.]